MLLKLLEKDSGLVLDTCLSQSELSNEQMFKSIKASMELLVEEVSGMAEILEALELDYIKDLPEMN